VSLDLNRLVFGLGASSLPWGNAIVPATLSLSLRSAVFARALWGDVLAGPTCDSVCRLGDIVTWLALTTMLDRIHICVPQTTDLHSPGRPFALRTSDVLSLNLSSPLHHPAPQA
jgi:hypothetical protein